MYNYKTLKDNIYFMDLNEFARRVTLLEGKKKSLSIAQVKEVIKIVFDELAKNPFAAFWELLWRPVPKEKKTEEVNK